MFLYVCQHSYSYLSGTIMRNIKAHLLTAADGFRKNFFFFFFRKKLGPEEGNRGEEANNGN